MACNHSKPRQARLGDDSELDKPSRASRLEWYVARAFALALCGHEYRFSIFDADRLRLRRSVCARYAVVQCWYLGFLDGKEICATIDW